MADLSDMMGPMRRPGDEAGDIGPDSELPGADPEMSYPFQRQEINPNQRGSTAPGSFDYAVERVPVYEWRGERFVGDLKFAPSWPQDLQPVDYVTVPIEPSHVT